MFDKISPLYMHNLLCKIHDKLWEMYDKGNISKTPLVEDYISRWREFYEDQYWNFDIIYKDNSKIDLFKTLRKVPNETLFKIALDLGIEVPALVPAIPEKIELKTSELGNDFQLIHKQITEAITQCYEKPDHAISLMYSALETTLKTILHANSHPEYRSGSSLKKYLPKVLDFIKTEDNDIQKIVENLISITESISAVRSEKCQSHGKDPTQKIITDPKYAFFCVNAIASVILFLLSTEKPAEISNVEDDLPF